MEFGALLDPVETMLDHLFLQLALGLPLAVIIITAGGYLLVRRALTPVEQITRAAERITQHNLSERLPVAHTGDELERLSRFAQPHDCAAGRRVSKFQAVCRRRLA